MTLCNSLMRIKSKAAGIKAGYIGSNQFSFPYRKWRPPPEYYIVVLTKRRKSIIKLPEHLQHVGIFWQSFENRHVFPNLFIIFQWLKGAHHNCEILVISLIKPTIFQS